LKDLMQFPKAEIEALWCPWRVEYFEQETPNPDFLSEAARSSDDAAHLVVTRRKNAFLMMNRYPYSVGHLMAVPYRKTGDASSLGENEVLELWNLAVHGQRLLRETMKAQGFNIGLNRRRCPRSCASPHRAAMEWRHEFHAGAGRDANALGRIARALRQIDRHPGTDRKKQHALNYA
jgi:hypothetical protein